MATQQVTRKQLPGEDTGRHGEKKGPKRSVQADASPILTVSVSPHIKSRDSVERIMWTVAACLMPPLFLSVFIFGIRSLFITLVSVVSCVAVEAISQRLLRRPITIKDGSAVITGLLLAYVIPPGVAVWMPILGAVMAIYVTKHLFGGLGFNIFNPALIGRAFLVATFPVAMTSAWISPRQDLLSSSYGGSDLDAISSATPLYVLKHFGPEALVEQYGSSAAMYQSFFLGFSPGCIGETSALLILLGGIFLIYKKYITWHIPVSMVVSVGLLTWVFGGPEPFQGNPILAILSGGVMLAAFFMATDTVTSPNDKTAKLIYGAGIGALTVLIRLKGGYPEGVCYAVLLMNPLTPALESWFKPRRFAPPRGSGQ